MLLNVMWIQAIVFKPTEWAVFLFHSTGKALALAKYVA